MIGECPTVSPEQQAQNVALILQKYFSDYFSVQIELLINRFGSRPIRTARADSLFSGYFLYAISNT